MNGFTSTAKNMNFYASNQMESRDERHHRLIRELVAPHLDTIRDGKSLYVTSDTIRRVLNMSAKDKMLPCRYVYFSFLVSTQYPGLELRSTTQTIGMRL